MKTMFAAYDVMAIWGVGASPELALADAKNWISTTDHLRTAAMTGELFEQVALYGGNCAFDCMNGVLSLFHIVEHRAGEPTAAQSH